MHGMLTQCKACRDLGLIDIHNLNYDDAYVLILTQCSKKTCHSKTQVLQSEQPNYHKYCLSKIYTYSGEIKEITY